MDNPENKDSQTGKTERIGIVSRVYYFCENKLRMCADWFRGKQNVNKLELREIIFEIRNEFVADISKSQKYVSMAVDKYYEKLLEMNLEHQDKVRKCVNECREKIDSLSVKVEQAT